MSDMPSPRLPRRNQLVRRIRLRVRLDDRP